LRWLADENLNNDILRGLYRRDATVDIVRAQDVGLGGASDEEVLAWAAREERIVLTHDVATITAVAYRRLMKGERMPGVFEIGPTVQVSSAIDDILLLNECSEPSEWEGQVVYLPLR
jgi:hypothetical protein